MGHAILTWRSCAFLAVFTGFCAYLNTAHYGPWTSKYDMPRQAKEKLKDIPEFGALFSVESHPALRKNDS